MSEEKNLVTPVERVSPKAGLTCPVCNTEFCVRKPGYFTVRRCQNCKTNLLKSSPTYHFLVYPVGILLLVVLTVGMLHSFSDAVLKPIFILTYIFLIITPFFWVRSGQNYVKAPQAKYMRFLRSVLVLILLMMPIILLAGMWGTYDYALTLYHQQVAKKVIYEGFIIRHLLAPSEKSLAFIVHDGERQPHLMVYNFATDEVNEMGVITRGEIPTFARLPEEEFRINFSTDERYIMIYHKNKWREKRYYYDVQLKKEIDDPAVEYFAKPNWQEISNDLRYYVERTVHRGRVFDFKKQQVAKLLNGDTRYYQWAKGRNRLFYQVNLSNWWYRGTGLLCYIDFE